MDANNAPATADRREFERINTAIYRPIVFERPKTGDADITWSGRLQAPLKVTDAQVKPAHVAVQIKGHKLQAVFVGVPPKYEPASLVIVVASMRHQLELGRQGVTEARQDEPAAAALRREVVPRLAAEGRERDASEAAGFEARLFAQPGMLIHGQARSNGFAAGVMTSGGIPYVFCTLVSNARLPAVWSTCFWSQGADRLDPTHEARFPFSPWRAPDFKDYAETLRQLLEENGLPPARACVAADEDDPDIWSLVTQLVDPTRDEWLRTECASALGASSSAQAVEALVERLSDVKEREAVAEACAAGLAETGSPEACAALLRVFEAAATPERERVRRACRDALVRGWPIWRASARWSDVAGERFVEGEKPLWRLEISAGDPRDVEQLTAAELRDLPKEEVAVIPLGSVDNGRFEATLRDSQLEAWNDPRAVPLVQLVEASD